MSKRILAIALILVGVAVIIFLLSSEDRTGQSVKEEGSRTESPVVPADDFNWDQEVRERPTPESLDSLRRRLSKMPVADSVAEIEEFLMRGEDRNTGLSFEIGSGGAMEGWPTLRVFLLDLLLELDPAAAARISREVLGTASSADEWAISLRNVARGETGEGNRAYLRAKTEELITNPEWQARPSVGYLNAFDVLVFTRATESSGLLSNLIQKKDRRDLAHAGFLTFDRLVQREPVEMLKQLQADLALQESRPEMTAQQFARADLRDGTQRELVKAWLLDPARSPQQLRSFAGSYPNNNMMISQNLLTSEDRVSGADLNQHDREVLSLIGDWRKDPEFEPISEYLEIMNGRLSQFVKSAAESSQ